MAVPCAKRRAARHTDRASGFGQRAPSSAPIHSALRSSPAFRAPAAMSCRRESSIRLNRLASP